VNRDGVKIILQQVLTKPVLVSNWAQYVNVFGGFITGAYLPDAVYGYFANGGGPCYVISLRALSEIQYAAGATQAASVVIPSPGRGGQTSFKVTAKEAGPAKNGLEVVITPGENDTFTMQVGVETKSGLVMRAGDSNSLADVRFDTVDISDLGANPPRPGTYTLSGGADAPAIVAPQPLTVRDYLGDPAEQTGFGGLEAIDQLRLLVCPDVMVGYDGSSEAKDRVKMVQRAMIDHCEKVRYCFTVLDTPPGLTAQGAKEWREYINFDTSYAALYYPWIEIADLSDSPNQKKLAPPSGHLIGLYNRTDAERGVHKAPANDQLRGVIGLERLITKGEQNVLNPLGVNCIRSFVGRGIRVWGARTLSSDGSWRYINVRRLFIFVESALEQGLQWVVFEPNDSTLWAKVRRDISSFLRVVWRSGALFGATPAQAFYVKCDEELNPPEVRDLGQLIIEVGLAPVKPAEFVIVRISQWAGADAEA
jgi:phage tail sheath protein FI